MLSPTSHFPRYSSITPKEEPVDPKNFSGNVDNDRARPTNTQIYDHSYFLALFAVSLLSLASRYLVDMVSSNDTFVDQDSVFPARHDSQLAVRSGCQKWAVLIIALL